MRFDTPFPLLVVLDINGAVPRRYPTVSCCVLSYPFVSCRLLLINPVVPCRIPSHPIATVPFLCCCCVVPVMQWLDMDSPCEESAWASELAFKQASADAIFSVKLFVKCLIAAGTAAFCHRRRERSGNIHSCDKCS